ncbi:MAG: winged helix-turn-helix domain-containing protein [Bryobacteraceae bacterium]
MVHQFGTCVLDTDKRQLSRAGQSVPLAPKTFDLLLLLVDSGGRALSKAELIKSLWPDTFVEEANLSFQISTLRKTLADDGVRIETVPKYGYRFTGDLVPTSQPQATAPPPARRFHWAILAAVVITAGAGLAFMGLRSDGGGSTPYRAVPLTAFPGIQAKPSLSPDGSQVAFAWNGPNEDNFDIYVKLVGPGEAVRLTVNPARDYSPAWSPDGKQIAFLRSVDGQRAVLFVMPALGGGLERKVADIEQPPIRHSSVLSWSPDSRYVVAATRFRENEPWGIWRLPLEGGPPERLTTAGTSFPFDSAPAFSPDGKSLAFIRILASNRNEIWIRNSNADTRRVWSEGAAITTVAWVDNRRLVYSGGSVGGDVEHGVRMVEPDSGKPPWNPGFGEGANAVSVARNGNLVYARHHFDVNLWRFDLTTPSAVRQRLAPSSYQNWTPAYSPDGRKIAFASTRSGLEEVWVADADGSHPVQVTRIGSGHAANPRWSPDGLSLVFNSWSPRSDLFVVTLSGGSVKRLTDDPRDELEPVWSRDGKWIYCGSNRTGRLELYRLPAAGGPLVQITRNGGLHAEESSDGEWIYYSKDPYFPTSIWKIPRGGGEETRVIEDVSYSTNFVPTAKGIYFVSGERRDHHTRTTALEFYDFSNGSRKIITRIEKPFAFGLTLSPDGRSLVHPLVDQSSSNLMLVENFR